MRQLLSQPRVKSCKTDIPGSEEAGTVNLLQIKKGE